MTRTPREIAGWSIAIVLVLFYALIPVIWIASLSLKPADQLSDKRFIPKDISWDNYDTIFSTSEFNRALVNSIGIAGISTLIAIVLASMAAYALSRLDFAGKAVILSGSLAVAMFPAISIVGSLFNIWRDVGLFDTWVGLIIPYMTFTLPLAIYTLSAFLSRPPRWTGRRPPRPSAR
jgi:multiple sugar transport system permease protein